jgi:hypothetical protein
MAGQDPLPGLALPEGQAGRAANEDPEDDTAILDRIEAALLARSGGRSQLCQRLPQLVIEALDFVLDPVRTGRTCVDELDKVEKSFIGLKVEHFFRDFLGLPKAARDLLIDGLDVDIKHTTSANWMIPPETFKTAEPVVLIMSAYEKERCSLGVMVAREAWLSRGAGNRDAKKSLTQEGRRHVRWLVKDAPLPASPWAGLDMVRFRALRQVPGGTSRAAAFFRENVGRVVRRQVLEALLFDQKDPMKRLRDNGGAGDVLKHEGIIICSGAYRRELAAARGIPHLSADEWVAVTA